jgi:hypothetical protein
MVFHPYTCGLRGGAIAVAATLIGYNNRGGCCWEIPESKTIVIDYSSTPTCDYIGSLLQFFFRYSAHLVIMTIYDPFTCKFPGWNGRYSASVAYPFPYIGIRAVLQSFWSGSFVAHLWLDQSGLRRGGSWLCHVIEWLVHVLSLSCLWHVPTGWNHHRD